MNPDSTSETTTDLEAATEQNLDHYLGQVAEAFPDMPVDTPTPSDGPRRDVDGHSFDVYRESDLTADEIALGLDSRGLAIFMESSGDHITTYKFNVEGIERIRRFRPHVLDAVDGVGDEVLDTRPTRKEWDVETRLAEHVLSIAAAYGRWRWISPETKEALLSKRAATLAALVKNPTDSFGVDTSEITRYINRSRRQWVGYYPTEPPDPEELIERSLILEWEDPSLTARWDALNNALYMTSDPGPNPDIVSVYPEWDDLNEEHKERVRPLIEEALADKAGTSVL